MDDNRIERLRKLLLDKEFQFYFRYLDTCDHGQEKRIAYIELMIKDALLGSQLFLMKWENNLKIENSDFKSRQKVPINFLEFTTPNYLLGWIRSGYSQPELENFFLPDADFKH